VRKATKSLIAFFNKIAYSLLVVLLAVQLGDAAPKKTVKKQAVNDKYAAIVIDAHSGKVLYQEHADAKRYPASLTKMMTLYMMFEALEKGRISLKTPIPVSAYAAARPPTKIGFKPGQTIPVEAAAKSLITRSANDVASAVAEYLGGSEKKFAQMMTARAHRLGMKSTNFSNASGLPDVNNYTTARDMARLSLALRRDFPKYYKLFNTTSFEYQGQTINSHNRLVKTMKGVDGIKTGYVRMSGFNIASSMQSEGKSIVAVVMGGRTSASRDAHVRTLLTTYIAKASKGRGKKGQGMMPEIEPQPQPQLQAQEMLVASNDVKGGAGGANALPTGKNVPLPVLKRRDEAVIEEIVKQEEIVEQESVQMATVAIPAVKPVAKNTLNVVDLGDDMSDREYDAALLTALTAISDDEADPDMVFNHIMRTTDGAGGKKELDMLITSSMAVASGTSVSNARKGWVVEVASRPSVREAELMLHQASLVANKRLSGAKPYLKVHDDDDKRFYRARFAGFADGQAARGACDMLKKADIDCHALED